MNTRLECRQHRARRAAASVIIAVAAGAAAVVHPAVGGASSAATEPTGPNPDVSTVATEPTSSTSTPVTSSSTTSTVPAGSCVDSSGQTVGTLPGQTECPEPLAAGECQSIDPADCLTIPEVIGLDGSAGPNRGAGSHGAPERGGASLRFTG
jgi:hypothetical protein